MITSRQNRQLKLLRRLRKSRGDQVLLEGPHLLRAALDAELPLDHILVSPEFLHRGLVRSLIRDLPFPPVEVEGRLLDELADSDSPRGIVAVSRLRRGKVATLPRAPGGLYLYLEGIQDPKNLGALARVAEGAAVQGIALAPGSIYPNHPRALRTSAGSLLRIPVAVRVTPQELDEHLQGLEPRWVALLPQGGRDLYATPMAGTLVFAVGAEGPGLSRQLVASSSLCVSVPVAPPVESLNVTVAVALALYELRRRRQPGAPGVNDTVAQDDRITVGQDGG